MSPIASLSEVVTDWAASRRDIVGPALVGSRARGTANPDSEIDLILLTPNPDAFHVSFARLTKIVDARPPVTLHDGRPLNFSVINTKAWSIP